MFQSVNEFPFWILDTLTYITLAPKIEKKDQLLWTKNLLYRVSKIKISRTRIKAISKILKITGNFKC